MKWLKFVIIVAVFGSVCAEKSGDEEAPEEGAREMRGLDREGWRAVEPVHDDNSGWIPQEPLPQYPKRRRLRKRKRRPLVTDSFQDEDELVDRFPVRRNRPQGLEKFQQPLEELSQESIRKPNIRRRVTPLYQPSEEIVASDDETNINPLSVTVRVGDETVNERNQESVQIFYGKTANNDNVQETSVPDLKTVLKQHANGLSLSEILQQKNLSLTELLMGSQKAISALTEKPNEVDYRPTDSETEKYNRLPSKTELRKDINRNFEQELESIESLTSREALEAQRKRLALLHHRDNSLFTSVTKLDVITEPTTEKRIFVPSHPKYYTSLNFKPKFNINNEPFTQLPQQKEEMTTVTTTTTSKVVQTTNKKLLQTQQKGLPMTNAKINKLKVKDKEEEKESDNYPIEFKLPEPIKINITEVFGYRKVNQSSNEEKNKDGPLRMSIDLEDLIEKATMKNETENEVYQKSAPSQTDEVTLTQEPPAEKLPEVTAKDEIMVILKDPVSRERLSRILEDRNMTLQELVDQRERGSSQLHLADIFHNKTREPEPKDEPFVGHVNMDRFSSFPVFERQQKSQSFVGEQINKYSTTPSVQSTETVEIKTSSASPKESYEITSFPRFKIEVNRPKENPHPFRWKELYPDMFPGVMESNYKEEEPVNPLQQFDDKEVDVQRLEDLDNSISSSSKERLNFLEENREEEDVLINIPSGVKSAIFVSLAIIGLSIVVFLTILLVFRWTQRQKTRMNYCSSLSSKLRTPIILQNRPANAIRTFVNETLGRKKNNYYRTNVQSMADEMWDDHRDRKPSF